MKNKDDTSKNKDDVSFVQLPSYAWHLGIDSVKLLIVLFKVVTLYDNRCGGCWASDKLLACYCFGCTINWSFDKIQHPWT